MIKVFDIFLIERILWGCGNRGGRVVVFKFLFCFAFCELGNDAFK